MVADVTGWVHPVPMARPNLRVLTSAEPVSMPVEPKRMVTFGDLFEDLRVHLDSGDRESLDLRLASLAVEYAGVPLVGSNGVET